MEVPESVGGRARRARRRRGGARRRHARDAARSTTDGARRRAAREPAPRRAGGIEVDAGDGGGDDRRRDDARAVGADERLAFLRPVIESIASPTIRNLATVGGNLFVEQPYGDLAVALLALDAEVDVAGPGRRATRAVDELGDGPRGRGRHRRAFDAPGDDVPLHEGDAAAAELGLDRDRRRRRSRRRRDRRRRAHRARRRRAASRSARAAAEAALAGGPLDRERAEAAGRAALEDAEPFDDAYASAWYRAASCPSTSAAPCSASDPDAIPRHRAGRQRRAARVPRPARHHAAGGAARGARPDRRQARLRAGHVRHLHRAARRRARDVLPGPGRDDRGRDACARSRASPATASSTRCRPRSSRASPPSAASARPA